MFAIPYVLMASAFGVFCFGRPDSFDAAIWRSYDQAADCSVRTRMVDDLITDELRAGRDRASDANLLGPFVPPEFGGPGLSLVATCAVIEQVSVGCASTGAILYLRTASGTV